MDRFKSKKLFLHMGPGFHAEIEKHLFGSLFPEVNFWNQPKVTSYHELVDAAFDQVLQMTKAGESLHLIAHSFGAQIAKDVIKKMKADKVVGLRLVNSAFSPFECFVNLAKTFPEFQGQVEAIGQKEANEKMQFIFSLATHPEFQKKYWFSERKFAEFSEVSKKFPALDLEVFAKIFGDHLSHPRAEEPWSWSGPVEIFYSQQDLLLHRVKDVDPWLKIFPNSQVRTLQNVGHYCHLENENLAEVLFQ